MRIEPEILESSEELTEKEREKTLHRKRREAKEKTKQKAERIFQSNHKERSGRKSPRWDDDDFEN